MGQDRSDGGDMRPPDKKTKRAEGRDVAGKPPRLASRRSFGVRPASDKEEQHPALKVLRLTSAQAAALAPQRKTYAVRPKTAGQVEDVDSSTAALKPLSLSDKRALERSAGLHRNLLALDTAEDRAIAWRRSRANSVANRWLWVISVFLGCSVIYQLGSQVSAIYQADLIWRELLGPIGRLEQSQESVRTIAGKYAGAAFALERHVSKSLLEDTRVIALTTPDGKPSYILELCRRDRCVLRDSSGNLRLDLWGRGRVNLDAGGLQ